MGERPLLPLHQDLRHALPRAAGAGLGALLGVSLRPAERYALAPDPGAVVLFELSALAWGASVVLVGRLAARVAHPALRALAALGLGLLAFLAIPAALGGLRRGPQADPRLTWTAAWRAVDGTVLDPSSLLGAIWWGLLPALLTLALLEVPRRRPPAWLRGAAGALAGNVGLSWVLPKAMVGVPLEQVFQLLLPVGLGVPALTGVALGGCDALARARSRLSRAAAREPHPWAARHRSLRGWLPARGAAWTPVLRAWGRGAPRVLLLAPLAAVIVLLQRQRCGDVLYAELLAPRRSASGAPRIYPDRVRGELVSLGPGVYLARALEDLEALDSPWQRSQLIDFLGSVEVEPAAAPRLAEALLRVLERETDTRLRIELLAQLGALDPARRPSCVFQLQHVVRVAADRAEGPLAAHALARQGDEGLNALSELLESEDRLRHWRAVEQPLLNRFWTRLEGPGPLDPVAARAFRAFRRLLLALERERRGPVDPWLGSWAGRPGARAEVVADLRDPDPEVRDLAARALRHALQGAAGRAADLSPAERLEVERALEAAAVPATGAGSVR